MTIPNTFLHRTARSALAVLVAVLVSAAALVAIAPPARAAGSRLDWLDRYRPPAMLAVGSSNEVYVVSGAGQFTTLIAYAADGVEAWRLDEEWVQYRTVDSLWVEVAANGQIVWALTGSSTGQPNDLILVSVSPAGQVAWRTTVMLPAPTEARRMALAPNGDVYVAAVSSTANRGALVAVAADGTPRWVQQWGGMRFLAGLDVSPDGSTIAVGGGLNASAEIIAYDSDGTRRFRSGELPGSITTASDLGFSPDGSLIHAAYTAAGPVTGTLGLATVAASSGAVAWSATYPLGSFASQAGRLGVAANGDVVVAGTVQRPQPLPYVDLYLVRVDAGGTLLWSRAEDFISGNDESPANVVFTPSGEVVTTVVTPPSSTVVAYGADGTPAWQQDFAGGEAGRWLAARSDGSVCAIGAGGFVSCMTPGGPPVAGNRPPIAFANLTRSVVSPQDYFLSLASTDPDGVVVNVTIDWGDGTSETTAGFGIVTHSYATPGRYEIVLTALDNEGAQDVQRWIVLHDTRDLNLATQFTIAATQPDPAVPNLSLSAVDVVDPEGAVAYEWLSGAGAIAFGPTVEFTYPEAGTYQVQLTVTDGEGARVARTQLVTVTDTPASPVVLVSSTSGGRVGAVRFADEDILAFDTATQTWSLYFDGSDVGLAATDVNGFEVDADGRLLLTFDTPVRLGGLQIDDSDVVAFTPTALGETTAGTFDLVFDGSAFGLSTAAEDVDAVALSPTGELVVSTLGVARIPGLVADDSDLLVVRPGGLELFFDGSTIGLTTASEDVGGASFTPDDLLALSTVGPFNIGLQGTQRDVFTCEPSPAAPTCTAFQLLWEGSAVGFGREVVDGHDVIVQPG